MGDNSVTLSASEREVVLGLTDEDPRTWRIYCDRGHHLRGTLVKLARRLGAEVRDLEGGGIEFDLPAAALSLRAKGRSRGKGRQFSPTPSHNALAGPQARHTAGPEAPAVVGAGNASDPA